MPIGSRNVFLPLLSAVLVIAVANVTAQDEEMVDPTDPAIVATAVPLTAGIDIGHRRPEELIEFSVTLRFNNVSELSRLLADQSDSESPRYHQYLTAEEFARRFGPTSEQLDRAVSGLRNAGFQVGQIAANRLIIHAVAPTGLVEKYFSTEIHNIDQAEIVERYTNVAAASVSKSMITLVKAATLNNLVLMSPDLRSDAITGPWQGPAGGFTPVGVATKFNFPIQNNPGLGPEWQAYDGKGRTAAIIIDSDVYDTDLSIFFNYFPISRTGNISRKSVDGGMIGKPNSDALETALDVETIGGLAPGANIIIYVTKSLANAEVDDAANTIVSEGKADVVNMSFGGPEFKDATFMSTLQQGNAEGITFVASTGDKGSNGGVINTPAAYPHVLAVGGTLFEQYSANDPGWSGSGGGVSGIFKVPSYQKGLAGLAAKGRRNTPDLSFPAVSASVVLNGTWTSASGTSWSSPTYVALQLAMEQFRRHDFGWVNPTIYKFFKQIGYNSISGPREAPGDPPPPKLPCFNDVTLGNNGEFSAVPGYDNVSGIGEPVGFFWFGLP